jgi:nitroimidazol reductase NimA-like FMN-containing flavoprotein (pyridoxamine 5'-phosphate oxidase superfamily)
VTLDDLTRLKEKRSSDRSALDQLLDEELVGTLATVTTDGRPWAVPMLYARDGDRLLLHGSTGAGALRQVAAGTESVFSVHAIDSLVLATSLFEHSANYRSAVVRGTAQRLTGDDALGALDRLSDTLVPGRRQELRGHLEKEVAATVVLALDITEDNWLLKVSDKDVDEELDVIPDDVWTGILPIHRTYGEPVRSPWLPDDLPAPPSVVALREAGPQRRGQRSGTNR